MGIGNSGRVVLEIEPRLKRELYAALSREGKSLKDWFIVRAESYLENEHQLSLRFDGEPSDSRNVLRNIS